MGKNKPVKVAPRANPRYIPSKRPRGKRRIDIENPGRVHLELKNFLQTRRLVVERSLNPNTRAEVRKLDLYLDYLRTLDPQVEGT